MQGWLVWRRRLSAGWRESWPAKSWDGGRPSPMALGPSTSLLTTGTYPLVWQAGQEPLGAGLAGGKLTRQTPPIAASIARHLENPLQVRDDRSMGWPLL